MMEETFLMNHIKEELCFVSQDALADLALSKGRKSTHKRVYVLPDGVHSRLGHVLDEEAGEQLPQQKDMVGRDWLWCAGFAHARCLLLCGIGCEWMTHQTPCRSSLHASAQVLTVNNERFMVPELIFRPSGRKKLGNVFRQLQQAGCVLSRARASLAGCVSNLVWSRSPTFSRTHQPTLHVCLPHRFRPDIGLAEASLAEMIVEAVEACHPALRGLLYSNVFLMGGTCRCPGFLERLKCELRPLVPDAFEVRG